MNYLHVQRQGKPAKPTSPIAVARIMTVYGGLARRKDPPLFRLELTTATGKPQQVNCHGTVAGVSEFFNELAENFAQRFVTVLAVLNPLPNLRRETVQPTLVRIGRIEEIRPNVGRRKAKSIIVRSGGLPPVLATEAPAELAERLRVQGYGGTLDEKTGIYQLAAKRRDAVPPPAAPKKRVKTPDPFSAQERFDF